MEKKMSSISSKTWRMRWCEPMGRMTPGRERTTRSLVEAADSTPDSRAAWRAAICAVTCARRSFRAAPTARLSSGVAGFSQLSVINVRTPDLRPSHWSRKSFQSASSWTVLNCASKLARSSANRAAIWSGCVRPSSARVLSRPISLVGISKDRLHRRSPGTEDTRGRRAKRDSSLRLTDLRRAALAEIRRSKLRPTKSGGSGLAREGFRLFGQLGKRGGVADRDVCENLAVDRDAGGFQTVNQLAVG